MDQISPEEKNEDHPLQEEMAKFLSLWERDLQAKEKEFALRHSEVEAKRDVDLKSIEFNDRENDRNLQAYQEGLKQLYHHKNQKFGLLRLTAIFIMVMAFIVVVAGIGLAAMDKPIGMEILKIALPSLISGIGGYGLGRGQREDKDSE